MGKHQQNLRVQVRRHRKRQPHVHPTRIPLHRRVDELLRLGEGDNFAESAGFPGLPVDLRFLHAEEGAVQEDVLAAGEFGVEARADFEEGGDSAAKRHRTASRGGDAGEDFEEGGFAGAVAADELERCAFRRTSPRFTSKLTSLSAQKVSISDSGLGRATGKGLNRGEREGRGEGLEDSGLGRATGKGLNRGETQWVSGERGGRGEGLEDSGLGRATGKGLNREEREGRGEGPWDCGLGRATGKGLNRGERGERREDRSDWGLAEG